VLDERPGQSSGNGPSGAQAPDLTHWFCIAMAICTIIIVFGFAPPMISTAERID
jgi:hypothetical protein